MISSTTSFFVMGNTIADTVQGRRGSIHQDPGGRRVSIRPWFPAGKGGVTPAQTDWPRSGIRAAQKREGGEAQLDAHSVSIKSQWKLFLRPRRLNGVPNEAVSVSSNS
jgi:hypothetical protein